MRINLKQLQKWPSRSEPNFAWTGWNKPGDSGLDERWYAVTDSVEPSSSLSVKLTWDGCDSDVEEQGETAPHQAPEHISNQLYGKYKEIKVGILLNCSNKYLGMKLYSMYWESSLLSGYFCRMSASALGGGLPVAHVNSPAVYPVSPPPPPTAASTHECPHQAAVRGSLAAPTWSVPPSLARRAPVWPRAPPGYGLGVPGGACGADRSAARACAPALGCWLVMCWPVDPTTALLAARSPVCSAPSSCHCFHSMEEARLLFVPEGDITSSSRLLDARTALRNVLCEEWLGPCSLLIYPARHRGAPETYGEVSYVPSGCVKETYRKQSNWVTFMMIRLK